MIRRKALAIDASIPIKSNSTLCLERRWILTLKVYIEQKRFSNVVEKKETGY